MDRAQLRLDLLDQLELLIDEVAAQKAVIGRVPRPIAEGRPLDDALSLKEIYGLLAALDAQVHEPFVRAALAGENPALPHPDAQELVRTHAWNGEPVEALLGAVQAARRELLALLEAADAETWLQAGTDADEPLDLYALAHWITQHDAHRLREVGYRLHDSHLTSRPGGLPR